MARIEPVDNRTATPEERARLAWILERFGRATNMKRTLAVSDVALHALMEWYPLRDVVQPFLGERLTMIFAHAISAQTDCLICSTYFRRDLIELGEDPDGLALDEREQAVVDFGRRLATDSNDVDDALYGRLASWLTPAQIVDLTAFGALMLATNVFNNALRIPLDDNLVAYQRTVAGGPAGG